MWSSFRSPAPSTEAHDTDRDAIGSSTLPMVELAAKFRSSAARAILLHCRLLFQQAAPARVLEGTPQARASFDYKAFDGKGRFL